VSQLVVYNDRIWFVNSQPYEDNNAADIYSYSPDEASVRYERSLFTQDAGNPIVHNGLLYWPFEDPRRSAGTGEFAVTDGANWQWQSMQSGSVMHVHAMNVCNDELVAVTGSWTGQLHRQDGNQRWRVQYDYPAGDASFSRLVNVSQFGDECIVAAAARGKAEAKLFSIRKTRRTALQGWPTSDRVDALTAHDKALFAFADSGDKRALLRYDGSDTTTISLPAAHRPRALHSDGQDLWLATQYSEDGVSRGRLWKYDRLWKYENETAFKPVADLEQVPIALAGFNGAIAIGTYASTGGALWLYGQAQSLAPQQANSSATLPIVRSPDELDDSLVQSLYDELFELILDSESTTSYARALRRQLGRHPQIGTPEFGAAVTRLLSVGVNGPPVTMFTRQSIGRQDLIRWYLLTTLAINGHGRVDPAWLNSADSLDVPPSGKVFSPTIAAIVATGWLNQNDNATLDALFKRLNRKSDPHWLKADVVGALTALTNERFGYDTEAWNQWWQDQQ